jgi:hypothetical protein
MFPQVSSLPCMRAVHAFAYGILPFLSGACSLWCPCCWLDMWGSRLSWCWLLLCSAWGLLHVVCMALRGCLRLSGIEDVGCLSRCHVLICAVEADWFSGCRLNEQMTRFGMCSLSLLGAGRAWLSNSTGESSCPLFLGCLCSFFFFKLAAGEVVLLYAWYRYVSLHDWLASPSWLRCVHMDPSFCKVKLLNSGWFLLAGRALRLFSLLGFAG